MSVILQGLSRVGQASPIVAREVASSIKNLTPIAQRTFSSGLVQNPHVAKRLLGPPTCKLMHGTTTGRFPYQPGDKFVVGEGDLFVGDQKVATSYAMGTSTSCRRKGEVRQDDTTPIVVTVRSTTALNDEDSKIRGVARKHLDYSGVGSGWWYVQSKTPLVVAAMHVVDKKTGELTPYKPELWPTEQST